MAFGLPGATAISSLFLAKITGVSTSPAVTSLFMLAWSADANTSAGAPCWIWVTRVLDPAKLNVRLRPGSADAIAVLAALKAPVSDAAAKTLRLPVSAGAVVVAAAVVGAAAAVVGVVAELVLADDE